MKFINHAEGYIEPGGVGGYDYVYQYKDHLGNVRLSYKDADDNGVIHGASTQLFFDDFEAATGWDGSGASWGQSITAFDDTLTFDGDYSGRIYGAMGTSVAVHSNEWVAIDNDSATDYVYTAWAYSESPIIRLGLGMKQDGEAGYLTLFDDILIIDELNKWVYVEKRVTVPAHITSLNVRIECAAWENRVGNVWFDNVSIRRVNAPVDVEIVEEKNYYPFGLKHKGYNSVANGTHYPYMFQGVEYNESLDLNLYEMDFRQYDPALGRFNTSDPLGEEHNWLSPYNFVQNNPVIRIDPSGLLDDYGLDQNGNIELIKKTDDDTDTLYSVTRGEDGELVKDENGEIVKNDTNGDGQVAEGDSVTVEKDILNNKKTNTVTASNGKAYTFDQFNITGDNQAQNLFEFVSSNSNVEWSLTGIGTENGAQGSNILTTSHIENSEIGGGYLLAYEQP